MPKSRFTEDENSVHFHKTGHRYHKSFAKRYHGLSYSHARKKMKQLWATQREQDEMIHYLKTKGVLKNVSTR